MRHSSLVLISSLTIASISCGEASRKDLLPRNTGSKGEVAVVAPDGVWKTSTGDTLSVSMDQLMYGLPQDELLLKRIEIKESGFNDFFKTHRNILKVEVHPDQKTAVKVRRDVYSRQQLYIVISIQTLEELPSVLKSRIKDIMQLFHQAEIDRLIERNKAFGSESLNKTILEKTGLNLTIQNKFQVAVDEPEFLWLRLDQSKPLGGYQHTISQGFLIYKRPYRDTADFSDSSLLAWKSEVNKKYVEGPQNSYMSVSDRFILPKSKLIIFNDQTAKEIRGLWRMEGYFMGGPFYALAFYNPNNGMQYMVEGYAYAPQFDKAPLIREVEAIAKSVVVLD